jgi:tetratricopeptide (TPR) repeat protein
VLPCVASSWVLVGLSHPERSFKTVQFQGSRSIEEAYQNDPENKYVLNIRGTLALEAGDLEASAINFVAYVGRKDLTSDEKAIGLNNLVYVYAILAEPEKLKEADMLLKQAIDLLPNNLHIRGTHASLQIAQGFFIEGEENLRKLQPEVKSVEGQVQHFCWLAMAAFKQNKPEEARQHFAEARRLQPTCFLISRFEQALGIEVNLPT